MSELTVGFMRELHVRGDWAGDKSRTEYENEFDRWLDQVRREAKVEALTEAASKDDEMIVAARNLMNKNGPFPWSAVDGVCGWLLDRAKQVEGEGNE